MQLPTSKSGKVECPLFFQKNLVKAENRVNEQIRQAKNNTAGGQVAAKGVQALAGMTKEAVGGVRGITFNHFGSCNRWLLTIEFSNGTNRDVEKEDDARRILTNWIGSLLK